MTEKKEDKNVIIRLAEKTDATAIEIILSTYFLDRDDIPHNRFFVAEMNRKVIGCAVFEKLKSQKENFWFYEIHTIAVMPSYKGKGYGKLLLDRLLSEIKELISNESISKDEKISRIVLTRTTAPNFFIHEGFEKADIEKTKYWNECVQCDKIEICSQTVLTKEI
ncbi:GNAT family N-acetyltransferase [Methanimicrococcus hongohii]|uniref:GNAT family N-acetyltransferase n=1 Tax=Methanimicrococcus hongohii TaxID=3028295 RepID=UPI00292FE454|nr:GNAT family N-acetyltransferase [Methanimicrococcus sp. Hf6]